METLSNAEQTAHVGEQINSLVLGNLMERKEKQARQKCG
jgi:hypothetical protein